MDATAIVPVPAGYADRPDAVRAPVAGRCALAHIVDALGSTAQVIVAAAPAIFGVVAETVAAQIISDIRIVVAEAPGGRVECLSAGLAICSAGPVLVHDLAWPVFSPATPERILAALADGALVAVPTSAVTDSVKRVDERGIVTATRDRYRLRTVQYPRGFDAATLRALTDGADEFDDEVRAALLAGVPVTQIEGDDRAQQFELPGDTDYLTAVIEARQTGR